MDTRSDVDEETDNQRAELGGHQHLNARGIFVRTRCRQCPHGVFYPFGSFLSDRWRQPMPVSLSLWSALFKYKWWIVWQQNHPKTHSKIIPKLLLRLLWFFRRTAALFRQIRTFPQLFRFFLSFGEFWNPTNCGKFNADGSLMGRTNLNKSVW